MELNNKRPKISIMRNVLERKTLKFLQKLREGPRNEVPKLLGGLKQKNVTEIFETIGAHFKMYSDADWKTNELISDNFLRMLLILCHWERPELPELLPVIYSIVATIAEHKPERKRVLEEMGIFSRLFEILKHEEKTNFACPPQTQTITAAHFIALFLPALPNSKCNEYVESTFEKILSTGGHFKEKNGNEALTIKIKTIFQTVCNVCLMPNSPPAHHVLLLKVIFWANALNILTRLMAIEKVVILLRMWLKSTLKHKSIVGLAIVHILISKHIDSFEQLLTEINSICLALRPFEWSGDIFQIIASKLLRSEYLHIYCIRDKTFSSTFQSTNDLILSLLKLVLPSYAKPATVFQKSDLKTNYSRLTSFIRCVLKLPRITDEMAGQLTVPDDGIKMFQTLVAFILRAMEANTVEDIFYCDWEDVDPYNNSEEPKSPAEIRLGLYQSQNLDMLLGPSNDAKLLSSDSLLQCLRLISIFHEINENWGVLFCALTSERLIDKKCFISDRLARHARRYPYIAKNCYFETPMKLKNYYYLLPFDIRHTLLKRFSRKSFMVKRIIFRVSRQNILNGVKSLDLHKHKNKVWKFQFTEHNYSRVDRTKEFYADFIGECWRHDFDLWIGDPVEDSNGVARVNAECGLFPKPKLSLSEESASLLKNIGLIMAKSIADGHMKFVDFSKSLYKMIIIGPFDYVLSLVDLKEVMPQVYNLVSKLVNILRVKTRIDADSLLSLEDKRKATENITFDGSPVQDLRINFTIPGFPEIEMKEGGKDIFLNIENIEEYLQLLTWWVLYKGPEKCADLITEYFGTVISSEYLAIFYLDEIQELVIDNAWKVSFVGSLHKPRYTLLIGHIKDVIRLIVTRVQVRNCQLFLYLRFIGMCFKWSECRIIQN